LAVKRGDYNMLIAFTGRAGSGKSTAAQALVDRDGYIRCSFAQPIKDMVKAMGISYAEMTDAKIKNMPNPDYGDKSPRYIMQTLGTEWGRNMIDPDIWINVWRRKLPPRAIYNIVVDDCRFENEVQIVKTLGGIVIKVNRISANTTVTHHSEVVPGYYDGVINNEGDIANLKRLAIETADALPVTSLL
jgi:hypothetical protein